jgi:EmrB/QacA subfamily drug resistance transporter
VIASPSRRRLILIASSAAVVLVIGMQAAINLAVPRLAAGDLHPSSAQMLWIVDAYVVVFASLLIWGGAAGDRYGRKGILIAGLLLFATGCGLCAVATDVPVLLGGRAITGLGAALALPNTLAVLLVTFPAGERPRAIAIWAGMSGVGGVVGNIGAGVILQLSSAAGLFAAFALVGLACAGLTAAVTPKTPARDRPQDPLGSLLLIAGLVLLVDAIVEGPGYGWGSALVLGSAALGILALALFVAWELRAEHPILDPRVFRVAPVRLASLLVTLLFVGLFGLFYINAQYVQQVKGYDALRTGLALVPMAVGMLVFARLSVPVTARIGPRSGVTIGLVLVAAGLLAFSTNDAGTSYLTYVTPLLVLSAGFGMCLPSLSTAIVDGMPAQLAGLGSGLNGAAREVGSALGVAVVGTILNDHLGAPLRGVAQHAREADAFTHGMATGIRVVAVTVLAAALLTAATGAVLER